jgi:hypothetical protein
MTTCLLIIFGLFFLLLFGSIAILIKDWWQKRNKNTSNSYRLNWQSVFAIVIALGLIGFSLLAPFLFTRDAANSDFDFTKTGAIGDTIGGLMNPFIALAGVIVTGLAFYMQYRANLLQRELFNKQLKKDKKRFNKELGINKDQFQKQLSVQTDQYRLQQFESQFYEMLRLHKENVNEIEIPAKRKKTNDASSDYEEYTISKRNAFVEFKNEFESILLAIKDSSLATLNNDTYKEAYKCFFWGLNENYLEEIERVQAFLHHDDRTLFNRLSLLKNAQFDERLARENSVKLNFSIIAYEGHSGYLGHYFRHLFLTVKFVVKQDFLSYKAKRKYLRVLRAQLSNHEQIMLFYNWLGGYGNAWEDEENKFFSEYCMIHNLWHNIIFEDKYIMNKIEYLETAPVRFRKGNMFEIDD